MNATTIEATSTNEDKPASQRSKKAPTISSVEQMERELEAGLRYAERLIGWMTTVKDDSRGIQVTEEDFSRAIQRVRKLRSFFVMARAVLPTPQVDEPIALVPTHSPAADVRDRRVFEVLSAQINELENACSDIHVVRLATQSLNLDDDDQESLFNFLLEAERRIGGVRRALYMEWQADANRQSPAVKMEGA